MKKCRSDFSWENCFCCTFCAIFGRLLRFLCHFRLFRQKTHGCFDPSASSVTTKKLQHVLLRMLRKFGRNRITPHWDRGELPVDFSTLKTRTSSISAGSGSFSVLIPCWRFVGHIELVMISCVQFTPHHPLDRKWTFCALSYRKSPISTLSSPCTSNYQDIKIEVPPKVNAVTTCCPVIGSAMTGNGVKSPFFVAF